MTTKQPTYQAYLLRLWPTRPHGTEPAVWRASLENPHTGQRLGFASLEQLFAYLIEQTGPNFSAREDLLSIET